MKYNIPEMEIVKFEVTDVITSSIEDAGQGAPSDEPKIEPGVGDNWD